MVVAITVLVVTVLAIARYSGDETAMKTVTVTGTTGAVNSIPTTSGSAAPEPAGAATGACEDVTSYDYNWDNDMKCTRPDGSIFYTDYAGAERFERYGDE